MKRKHHRPEQIVKLLREAETKLAQGQTVDQVCRQLGISDATSGQPHLNFCVIKGIVNGSPIIPV